MTAPRASPVASVCRKMRMEIRPTCNSSFGHHDGSLAVDDQLVTDKTFGLEDDLLLLAPDLGDGDTRHKRVPRPHRRFEAQGLAEIDRARSRQLRGQDRRDEAGAEHAMR